jgi:hypothetical protein
MNEDNSFVRLRQPDAINDPLTASLRSELRRLLEQAIEAEAEAIQTSMKELKQPDGPGPRGPAWSWPGALDSDRDRTDRGSTGQGP